MSQLVTIQNLNAGVSHWRTKKAKWPADFHNQFYQTFHYPTLLIFISIGADWVGGMNSSAGSATRYTSSGRKCMFQSKWGLPF